MANRLALETSPYLRQHQNNPVDWYPWGEQAIDAARLQGKPILLSVGYAACHWCHVMAHESFEDPAIATLMNERFINIKLDREERPDLDMLYQTALQLMGEQGGWPLTLFLTEACEPFWGGTYFPPTRRYGRPAFRDVLMQIAEAYANNDTKIDQAKTALRSNLLKLAETHHGAIFSQEKYDALAKHLTREVDPFDGGIGTAPKFMHCPIFELLWRAWMRSGQEPFRHAVLLTLTAMAQGGIYDHLGGGFARYSVDARWLVPHFEKMLYDNAQLIDLLTLVWQGTGNLLFKTRVEETVDWLLREMQLPGGGFAGTLDADSEGEEGRFYVWQRAEIDTVLGEDADFFAEIYDVTPQGNWEGKTILNRIQHPDLCSPEKEAILTHCRNLLQQKRAKRIRPALDDKVLVDWNGLLIAALANAGLVFEQPDWISAASRAYDFIKNHLKKTNMPFRLYHSWCQDSARHPATLDDYAALAKAALALYEAIGEVTYRDDAEALVASLDTYFWDPEKGGYFFSAHDTTDLICRSKIITDNATPSGNGMMVRVLASLYFLTGRDSYRHRAEEIITTFSGAIDKMGMGLGTFLNNANFLTSAQQIVIIGAKHDPRTLALRRIVLDLCLPNRLLLIWPPDENLPQSHPAYGKDLVQGKPAAYVCVGPKCSLPFIDPQTLRQALIEQE